MADNYTAERSDRPIVKADYFGPMNYTSSFAEIRPRFSRSRDPIYVTHPVGGRTCGTSRGISGTTRRIHRGGPADRFDELHAAKMRERYRRPGGARSA
jgi:hypothetical protein